MRILSNILLLLGIALGTIGCNDTAEENLEQRDDIITYLTTSHSPTLIAWGTTSLDDEPKYYFTSGVATFMYISTYYDAERDTKTEIQKGSNITITFTLYDFESITTPTITEVLYSNDGDIITKLVDDYGLNPQYWSSEPLSIKVGDGALFAGVESLMVGCREGDELEFYMTLDEAYGSDVIGLSTLEAPVAFFCEILTVN